MLCHGFHNLLSCEAFKILLQSLMRTTETLLASAKSILFPLEANDNLTNNLHDSFRARNTQLHIVAKPDVTNIGGWKDKVDSNGLLVAVNFHHQQVIDTKQLHLFTCPWTKGPTFLHSSGTNGHGSLLESKSLFCITATWCHKTKMTTL